MLYNVQMIDGAHGDAPDVDGDRANDEHGEEEKEEEEEDNHNYDDDDQDDSWKIPYRQVLDLFTGTLNSRRLQPQVGRTVPLAADRSPAFSKTL